MPARNIIFALLFTLSLPATADSLATALKAIEDGQTKQAAQQLIPLANAGNSVAQVRLGSLYYLGQGVPEDEKQAVEDVFDYVLCTETDDGGSDASGGGNCDDRNANFLQNDDESDGDNNPGDAVVDNTAHGVRTLFRARAQEHCLACALGLALELASLLIDPIDDVANHSV